MIATISAIGRLGNDPEQKVSLKGAEYILFNLAVDRGFGDRKETDWYRCIAFGSTRERILKLKAAKGSLVHVIGAQELEKFKRKDGSEGMAPKITLYDLEYVPGSGKKEVQPQAPVAQQPPDAGNDGIEEIRVSGDKLPF